MRATRLPLMALRRGEDRYVDRLIEGVRAPCVLAAVARAFIDHNRDPDEIDPELFDHVPPTARVSDRVAAGLGIVPRAFVAGEAIYAGRLPIAEAHRRIAAVHVPYHDEIARLLGRARAREGHALLIDCHSMPSRPGTAQAVLGDLNGRSAAGEIVDCVEAALRDAGFTVARNAPYAGAYTLERHGRPRNGVHAVQIELDRALYLDSERLTLTAGAARVAERLAGFAADVEQRLAKIAGQAMPAIAAE